jgi:hypothetical protein
MEVDSIDCIQMFIIIGNTDALMMGAIANRYGANNDRA